jgi:superfamily I DNA and/or RNA helicase
MTRKEIMEILKENNISFNNKAKLAELEELYLTIDKEPTIEPIEEPIEQIEEPKEVLIPEVVSVTYGELKKMEKKIKGLLAIRRKQNVEAEINKLTAEYKKMKEVYNGTK